MAADLSIPSGTARPLGVALEDNANPPAAINLAGATEIVWQVVDSNQRVILKKYKSDGGIIIVGNTNAGVVSIQLAPDDTSPAFGVGSSTKEMTYSFELRLYFGDDDQEISFSGTLTITPTTTWGAEDTSLVTVRRVVVQGRF